MPSSFSALLLLLTVAVVGTAAGERCWLLSEKVVFSKKSYYCRPVVRREIAEHGGEIARIQTTKQISSREREEGRVVHVEYR